MILLTEEQSWLDETKHNHLSRLEYNSSIDKPHIKAASTDILAIYYLIEDILPVFLLLRVQYGTVSMVETASTDPPFAGTVTVVFVTMASFPCHNT